MPIPQHTALSEIARILGRKIADYNRGADTAAYNREYERYIVGRAAGIANAGSFAAWVRKGGAAGAAPFMRRLLNSFGMDARNSKLVHPSAFEEALAAMNPRTIDWVSGMSLPLTMPPSAFVNPDTGGTLSVEIAAIYGALAARGAVTVSGGYVAASKAMHCLFPELAPMVDGTHSGISYSRIVRETYTPPLGIVGWEGWLGAPIGGVPKSEPAWRREKVMDV